MADYSDSVLVVAGEASGDLHGARVASELKKKVPGLKLFGVGGKRLVEQGLEQLGDPECLNMVGLSEVLLGLPRVLALRQKIFAEVHRRKPRVALLVDLPGFNLNLALHLRKQGVRVVYYIAPQAWAWRKGRVKKIRRRVDKLCVIFPFEEKFFKDAGVAATFVGHPLMEEDARAIPAGHDKKLALVPGSRRTEILRLLPAMAKAARLLQDRSGPFDIVLPVAPGLDKGWIRGIIKDAGIEARLVDGGATKALRGAWAAYVASGTATLEAAICQVPMVAVYRVSRITYAMVRPMYHLKYFCIVNILAGKKVVPELLQGSVRPDIMATELEPMLEPGPGRQLVQEELKEVVARLKGPKPSEKVSRLILDFLEACA